MTKKGFPIFTMAVLGIEAGGTRTVAVLAEATGKCLKRVEVGPANLRLVSDAELRAHFGDLASQFPRPDMIGIGMAGAREESDRHRIREAAERVWPRVPCWVGNDLDTALAAAELGPVRECAARVIVISGTGSCCYGRSQSGQTAKVGGWGHLLGDRGSGYDIALRAMQAVLQAYDRTGDWPRMGQRFLRWLALNEANDLVTWVHAASKAQIAAIAVEVFAAAKAHEPLATRSIQGAADALIADALACASHLANPAEIVDFVFTGGTMRKQPGFAALVRGGIRRGRPSARVRLLEREAVWGAVALGQKRGQSRVLENPRLLNERSARPLAAPSSALPLPIPTAPSPTEERNPRSRHLDRMPLGEAIRVMLGEDAKLVRALLAEKAKIERIIRLVVASFRLGGRLIYVGAGTSGRLGVLDASECPPTFSVASEMVQGVIAGGYEALSGSIEGAEDDAAAGARAIEFRGVQARDVVVGIAASGRTPFVWGALDAARRKQARTVLICFNPNLKFPRGGRPDLVLAPRIGPEVLTGSTRLKAGTATKLLLNMVTTLAMVRLGKVVENLMVDVQPSNAKLRDRATRIVQTLTGADEGLARKALEQSGWVVKRALRRLSGTAD